MQPLNVYENTDLWEVTATNSDDGSYRIGLFRGTYAEVVAALPSEKSYYLTFRIMPAEVVVAKTAPIYEKQLLLSVHPLGSAYIEALLKQDPDLKVAQDRRADTLVVSLGGRHQERIQQARARAAFEKLTKDERDAIRAEIMLGRLF